MVIRIAGALQVDLNRFGVKVSAVLEFNPRTQLNGVGQAVRARLIAFRQHVGQLHLFIEAEQPLIERFRHRLRQRVIGVVRIERGEVRPDGDNRVFCRPGGQRRHGAHHARSQ